MNHKTQEQSYFMKSKAIMLLNVKITVIWDFMPCGQKKCTSQGLATPIIGAGYDTLQTT